MNLFHLSDRSRSFIQLIPNLKNLTYTECLQKLKLSTLIYRQTRGDMIETYKILNNYNENVTPLIKLNAATTRGNKFRPNKDIQKFAFTNRIVNIWNKLPGDVVNVKNLITFENRLHKFWAKSDFKYDFKAPLPWTCAHHT